MALDLRLRALLASTLVLAACRVPSCSSHGGDAGRSREAGGGASAAPCEEIIFGIDPWRSGDAVLSSDERGRLIGCTHVLSASAEMLRKGGAARLDLGATHAGAELFHLRYVTEARRGEASLASALVYAPTETRGPAPVVLLEHGTTGMGPSCAPSRSFDTAHAIAMPFVARGYAVVVPDYVGLGIDARMTSYLVGEREASSSLDALRAARSFRDRRFDGTRLADEVVVVGYSQGGHAALFTHARFDPARDGRLLGSVSFSPVLGDLRAWKPFFAARERPTDAMTLYAAMTIFAHAAEHGDVESDTWFSPKAHALLPTLFHEQCLPALAFLFREAFPTQADLYQPAFQAAAEHCGWTEPCPDVAPWGESLRAEEPGTFRSDAPALILAGEADEVVPRATVACIRARLERNGTRARVCSYAGIGHGDLLPRALGDALRWIGARRRGEEEDVCTSEIEARACDDPAPRASRGTRPLP